MCESFTFSSFCSKSLTSYFKYIFPLALSLSVIIKSRKFCISLKNTTPTCMTLLGVIPKKKSGRVEFELLGTDRSFPKFLLRKNHDDGKSTHILFTGRICVDTHHIVPSPFNKWMGTHIHTYTHIDTTIERHMTHMWYESQVILSTMYFICLPVWPYRNKGTYTYLNSNVQITMSLLALGGVPSSRFWCSVLTAGRLA